MTASSKVGRNAHDFIRQEARAIAQTYRQIFDHPGDRLCLNPEDHQEDQQFISKLEAFSQLLSYVERFAETGNFGLPVDVERVLIREDYRANRLRGSPRTATVKDLAEKYSKSESTIERTIQSVNLKP